MGARTRSVRYSGHATNIDNFESLKGAVGGSKTASPVLFHPKISWFAKKRDSIDRLSPPVFSASHAVAHIIPSALQVPAKPFLSLDRQTEPQFLGRLTEGYR